MKKKKHIIHVNRQFIAMNAKDGKNRPVFTTKVNGKVIYSRGVTITGTTRLISPGKQLACGARAWIETYDEVEYDEPMSFAEAKLCE